MWEVLTHPLDMSPCLKIKRTVQRSPFSTLNDLNLAMTTRIQELNSNGLLDGVKKFPDRWKCVTEAKGDYIERCNVKIDSNE